MPRTQEPSRLGLLVLAILGCFPAAAAHVRSQPPDGELLVTGSEHLVWDQTAADSSALSRIRYAVYVDDRRSELEGVECAGTPEPSQYVCRASLPPLPAGSHVLELAAFVVGDGMFESARSNALRLAMSAEQPGVESQLWQSETLVTADNVRLQLERIATGLQEPIDMAFAPDGRILVAERGGRVQIVNNGLLQPEPALSLDDDMGPDGLLALALDPEFEQNGFVYLIFTARGLDGRIVFRLARFRLVNGMLAERAALLPDVPANPDRPTASLRFGPDDHLYAAFDSGGVMALPGDLASFNGKILRLNADGTTPMDQPGATPVYAYDLLSPHGLDWQPATALLWVGDEAAAGAAFFAPVTQRDGRFSLETVETGYGLPQGADVSALRFYSHPRLPAFRGNLLIASRQAQAIFRVMFDPQAPTRIAAVGRLFETSVGAIRALGVSPTGEIYFCTSDALGRLRPV